MTRPGRVDGSPDDRAAAFRPGEARTADLNPERRLPDLSVACCVRRCQGPQQPEVHAPPCSPSVPPPRSPTNPSSRSLSHSHGRAAGGRSWLAASRLLPCLARACSCAVSLDACPRGTRSARRASPHRGARGTSEPGGAPMAGAALACRSGPRASWRCSRPRARAPRVRPSVALPPHRTTHTRTHTGHSYPSPLPPPSPLRAGY